MTEQEDLEVVQGEEVESTEVEVVHIPGVTVDTRREGLRLKEVKIPFIGETPTKGAKMKYAAWKLSGQGGLKLEDCPLGLSKLYSRVGRRTLRSAMDWGSDIGPSTAEGISWTSLSRLL